jgi:hypothetical protein
VGRKEVKMNIVCKDLLFNFNEQQYLEKLYKSIGNVEYMEIKPDKRFNDMVNIKCITYSHELLEKRVNINIILHRIVEPQKLAKLF